MLPAIGESSGTASPLAQRAEPDADFAPTPVHFTYDYRVESAAEVAGANAQGARRRGVAADSTYNGYTSTAAPITISLNVTPLGGATANYGGSCTAAASGTAGTCTVTFSAARGPTTFSGILSEGGATIARFSQMQVVQPNAVNAINFTANPVVASVALSAGSPTTPAGTVADIPLVISALDANGRTIAGSNQFVDANGNALSFALSVDNAQAGGSGNISLIGPARITAPGQRTTYAHYDGRWLNSATISIKSNGNALSLSAAAAISTTLQCTEYATGVASGNFNGITVGADGNFWVGTDNASVVARITPNLAVTQFSSGITSGGWIESLALAPDGNVWFTEYSGGVIAKITPSGTVTEYPTGGLTPVAITTGPDGALWFSTYGTAVGRMTTSGKFTSFTVNGSRGDGLQFAPDGRLWIAYSLSNFIGRIVPFGTETDYSTAPLGNGGFPDSVAVGADGNMWLISPDATAILRATPGGTVTQFTSGITANAGINNIVAGPDGNLWFTESGLDRIARITPAGVVTEFGGAAGLSGGSGPAGIVVGADGNLWITEYNVNKIARCIL